MRGEKLKSIFMLCLTVGICGVGLYAVATPGPAPNQISYQGRLQQGGAPANGMWVLGFSIYDDADPAVAPTPIWGIEQHNLFITNGNFSVQLGSVLSIPDSVFDESALYLAVTVQGTALVGRTRILPSPQTVRANRSRFEVPVGGVLLWWGDPANLPLGFEVCDGQAPTTVGATLIGNKPDLRDRFVKGLANGQTLGQTGGNNDIPSHTHSGVTGNSNQAGPSQGASMPWHNGRILPEPAHNHTFTTSANSNAGAVYGNAPAFVSMHYIIRVLL